MQRTWLVPRESIILSERSKNTKVRRPVVLQCHVPTTCYIQMDIPYHQESCPVPFFLLHFSAARCLWNRFGVGRVAPLIFRMISSHLFHVPSPMSREKFGNEFPREIWLCSACEFSGIRLHQFELKEIKILKNWAASFTSKDGLIPPVKWGVLRQSNTSEKNSLQKWISSCCT